MPMPTITSTPTSGSSAMSVTTVTSAGSSKSTTASMTSSSITPTTTSATNSSPMPTTSTTATGSSSTAASSTSIITGSTIDSSIAIQIFNSEPSLIENLKALTKDERDLFLTKAVGSFQGSIVQGEKLGAGTFGQVISCNVDDTKFAVKKFLQTEPTIKERVLGPGVPDQFARFFPIMERKFGQTLEQSHHHAE
jgi:hypothetical protein